MTTSISPVSQPHVSSRPHPAARHAQAAKPPAKPAPAAEDKVTLRSTQKASQNSDHG